MVTVAVCGAMVAAVIGLGQQQRMRKNICQQKERKGKQPITRTIFSEKEREMGLARELNLFFRKVSLCYKARCNMEASS